MTTQIKGGNFHPDMEDTKSDGLRKFFLRNLLVIVSLVLMLMVYFALSGVSDNRAAEREAQQQELLSLRGQLKMANDDIVAREGDAVSVATGGMDTRHKADDDTAISELMEMALTWNGLSEYLDRREQVMSEYNFASDSQFMRVFMPGEDEGVVRTAPSGETYSAFDADMNNQFVSLESYVTDVGADVYSYVAVVEMRTASSSGAASELRSLLLSYDMINGEPANVNAFTVPSGYQRSG